MSKRRRLTSLTAVSLLTMQALPLSAQEVAPAPTPTIVQTPEAPQIPITPHIEVPVVPLTPHIEVPVMPVMPVHQVDPQIMQVPDAGQFTQHLPMTTPDAGQFTQHMPMNTPDAGQFVQHMPMTAPDAGQLTQPAPLVHTPDAGQFSQPITHVDAPDAGQFTAPPVHVQPDAGQFTQPTIVHTPDAGQFTQPAALTMPDVSAQVAPIAPITPTVETLSAPLLPGVDHSGSAMVWHNNAVDLTAPPIHINVDVSSAAATSVAAPTVTPEAPTVVVPHVTTDAAGLAATPSVAPTDAPTTAPTSTPEAAASAASTSTSTPTTVHEAANSASTAAASAEPAATAAPRLVNLDLSSTTDSVTIGHFLQSGSVTITTGGQELVITPTTLITAAEKVAAIQVLQTGHQSLIVDAQGNAEGGSMVITPWLSQHIGNLIIPQGVSVTDLSNSGTLSIAGNLSGAGSLYVGSANGGITDYAINAGSINLSSTGLISNILPTGGAFSLPGSILNLSLFSNSDIINSGSIVSSGNLTLTANGGIFNTPSAGSSFQPILQAGNDISLFSGTGNIVNAGMISALSGNINLATLSPSTNLNVGASQGTFQSLNGAINLQAAGNTGYGDINANGGDWISKDLNFNGGGGTVTANIGKVTGITNVKAGAAYVTAATESLKLGTLDLSGDPTFYNTLGSVTLGSAISVSGDLAIIASQDVIATNLTSAPGSGQAGHMTLIAGANITPPPASVNSQVGPDSSTTLTVNGGSATGGSIQVSGNIATNSGNLIAVAYSGSGAGSGYTPGSINIAGATNTSRGSVTMIAGATTGTGISTGAITSSGVLGNSGNAGAITLITADPIITSGTFNVTNGTLTPLSPFQTTGLTSTASSISTGNLLAAGAGGGINTAGGTGGAINIQAGTTISTGSIRAFGGGGGGGNMQGTLAQVNGGAGGAGGSISLTSGGATSIAGDMNTSGGGGGGGTGDTTNMAVGGAAGNITVASSGTVNITGPVLAAGGGFGGRGAFSGGTGLGSGPGGGSFGGGGGASGAYVLSGAGGGGGFTGGGGSGAGANTILGGSSAGGGFSGGGGGGGGAQGYATAGAAGGGGGGIGVGGGGGGSTVYSFSAAAGGAAGGAGGANGGDGSNYLAGSGGAAGSSPSGGNGQSGQSYAPPSFASFGGAGGTGGGAGGNGGGGGAAGPGGNPGGNGGLFGQAGTPGPGSAGIAAGDVGSSGAGGAINISGVGSVVLSGTIGSLATITGSTGFTGLSYSGDSVNSVGTGGTINVGVTSPSVSPTYFTDANYASGAATYLAPTGGINISGNLHGSAANTVTLNGVLQAPAIVTGPISAGGVTATILEGTNNVTIGPGSFVTPAEYIAFVQVATTGLQSLVLSQTAIGTTPGTGYASNGNFTVAPINIPAGNFSNLNLPANVIANITAPSLSYTGTALINGTMNFNGSATQLNVGSTTTVGGIVNFNAASGGTLISSSDLSGVGTITTVGGASALTLQSTNGSIYGGTTSTNLATRASNLTLRANTVGQNVRVANNQAVSLNASGAGNNFFLLNAGTITLNGDINSNVAPGVTITLQAASFGQILEGSTPGRLYAGTTNLITQSAAIGSVNNRILLGSGTVSAETLGAGAAYLSTDRSALVSTGSGAVSTFDIIQTGNNATLTVAPTGIQAFGNTSLVGTGTNNSVVLNGASNASLTNTITATGTGTITGAGLVSGSTVALTTGGGNIGTSAAAPVNIAGTTVNFNTTGLGDVYLTNTIPGYLSTNFGTVRDLNYSSLNDGTITVYGPGISSSGDVTITGTSSNRSIAVAGDIATLNNKQINLTAAGVSSTIANLAGGGTLIAGTVNLQTGGGAIGGTGDDIRLSAVNVDVRTSSLGAVYLTNNQSANITTGSGAPGSTGDFNYNQTGSGAIGTVGTAGINSVGAVNLVAASGSNGGFNFEGNVTAGAASTIRVAADGTGTITESAFGPGVGTLRAGQVLLYTGGGDIGSLVNPILTDTPILQLASNGTGNVFVNDIQSVLVTTRPGAGGAVANLSVTETASGGRLSVGTAGITSTSSVVLLGLNDSNINLEGNINANTTSGIVQLIATGTGTITENALGLGSGTITANQALLETTGGAIGTSANPILLSVPNASVKTYGSGDVFLSDNVSVNIDTGTGGGNSVRALTLTQTGSGQNIAVSTVGISATNDVLLTGTTGQNNSVDLEGNITTGAAQTISLVATGTGVITENAQGLGSGTLTAGTVRLTSAGGNIGASGNAILTSAPALVLASNGTGDVFVDDNVTATVRTAVGATGRVNNLTVTETGAGAVLSVIQNIRANGNVTLQAAAGSNAGINFDGDVLASTSGLITVIADGTGAVTELALGQSVGFLSAGTVNVTTGGGDVGTIAAPLFLSADNAQFATNSTGAVYAVNVNTNQTVTTGSGAAGSVGSFNYLSFAASPGTITVGAAGINAATDVRVEGFLNDTSVDLQGDVTVASNPSSSAFLHATGIGSITNSGNKTVTADQVYLLAENGSIGTAANPMLTSTPQLEVVSFALPATGSSAYVSNDQAATLLQSGVTNQFSLSNNGNLLIAEDLTANGINGGRIDLNVNGTTTIAAGKKVQANGTTGAGGQIQFSGLGTPDVTVVNNGTIEARNTADTSGAVGFNGGVTGEVDLSGGGTTHGGEFVSFGNLDPVSLDVIGGGVVPPTNSYTRDLVTFSQGAIVGNEIRATFTPPPVPTPETTNGASGNSPLAAFLAYQAQLAYLNQQNTRLFEQIGTRIATDYTPVYPQNRMFPNGLVGGIEFDRLAQLPGQAIFGSTAFNADELAALSTQGIQFGPDSKNNFLSLLQGHVLFAPDKEIEVEVREGKIYIPKGAIAWVMETGADSAIYDMHDSLATGPIRVVANNKTITMGPGQQILLTRNLKASFAELNPGSVVGYRNIRSAELGGGIKSFVCDFSIPHGLNNVKVIHGLLYSQEPKHQKLVRQMLKNAAILADLSAQHYKAH